MEDVPFAGGCLRRWQQSDAQRLVLAWNDPEISRWNQVPPDPTLATAERWIEGQTTRLDKRLSVDMAVEGQVIEGQAIEGQVIEGTHQAGVVGEVGLSGFSDRHKGALIGYWLLPSARGIGLASAAVAAFVDWAQQAFDLDVIVARCHENNIASQRVAARAGFDHESTDAFEHQLWRSRTRGK